MQGFAAQQPEHDTRAVEDNTLVPASHLHTLYDLINAVAQVTDGGTSRRMRSPIRGEAVRFPSRDKPLANQSALPAT